MALRLHFTAGDLARTRIATHPHPTWELVLSLHVIQHRHIPARHSLWRTSALERLNHHPHSRHHLTLLTELTPARGSFPDFLTPYQDTDDFTTSLDTVLSTPVSRLAVELTSPYLGRQPSAEVCRLGTGDLDAVHALGDAMSWYHDLVLAPHWSGIDRVVRNDRTLRSQDIAAKGIEGLLNNLSECIWWVPPVLHADYLVDREIQLGGRGLTLIPSYFCWGAPVAFIDPELPPVLVYPITDAAAPAEDPAALASLLGGTRAQVLRALRVPRSTTDLAECIHASPAAASKHATVLRHAGLICSVRRGNLMRHIVTELGEKLLDACHERRSGGSRSPSAVWHPGRLPET
ncbi:winged helix-turn-helix domain-containing protein [Kutzneria viridogrisea]|uniref:HTH arsR-type domain-containing protein n=2 Tax=Kutzneria TaxID=43356 RepID=W5WA92_9PSEU|nr:helix-turn-helix domain-containing protein [Kutzneria albida]AHH97471.1 hypothetical protein KALB_4107 [Kutzneria albida DSM 43870]MBA8930603.1 DNA-binding transcriptional ArsR family regulator [Kutzneria viridogrisea]